MVQLSHPYITTEKTIALTRQTFVNKVMSMLFNVLSRSGNSHGWRSLVGCSPWSGKESDMTGQLSTASLNEVIRVEF